MSKKKLPWEETNAIMIRANFSHDQSRLAQIWASRDHPCPKCEAPPYVGCRNLTGIQNFGFAGARENKYPHSERIDYDKLKKALNERGYQ